MGQRKVKVGRISDVDIRLLRIFQAVVDCGGLSAAEVELGIGRSTISTHLADIETRLGVRLCERGRSGFALTAEGMKVYQASLGLMRSLQDFQDEIGALHGRVGGELKVGLVDNLIWDRDLNLAQSLRQFSEVGSDVNLSLYVLSPDEIEKRLIDGSLSVGVTPVHHQLPSLQYRMIFDEVSYLYCGKGHPLFGKADEVTESDLMDCSYVRKGYAVSASFEDTNERLSHHINAFHVEAIAMMVLTGAHVGFLPENYAHNWEASGLMRKIRPDNYRAVFEFGVVTHRSRSASPAQIAFVNSIMAALQPQYALAASA